jgi:hypothetical protein
MTALETSLNEIRLILENLKELHYLTKTTPEFQEGERQVIIQDFRVRMINLVLARLKGMNRSYEDYKDRF